MVEYWGTARIRAPPLPGLPSGPPLPTSTSIYGLPGGLISMITTRPSPTCVSTVAPIASPEGVSDVSTILDVHAQFSLNF